MQEGQPQNSTRRKCNMSPVKVTIEAAGGWAHSLNHYRPELCTFIYGIERSV